MTIGNRMSRISRSAVVRALDQSFSNRESEHALHDTLHDTVLIDDLMEVFDSLSCSLQSERHNGKEKLPAPKSQEGCYL